MRQWCPVNSPTCGRHAIRYQRVKQPAERNMGLGMGELLLILAIVLLVFGANKLPQLANGLGTAIKTFKRASADDEPPKAT